MALSMKRIISVLAVMAIMAAMVATLAVPAFADPVVGDSPRCERGQFKAALIPPGEKPIQNRIKNATNVFECAIGDPPGKGGEIQ